MAIKARDKLAQKRSRKGYAKIAESNKLLELLSRVPDHRKGQGKRHKLEHILYLAILAGLMGATDYKRISIWIDKHVQKEVLSQIYLQKLIVRQ